MTRRAIVLAVALTAGCTPLGLWVYEEPRIGLQDVLIDTSTSASALPPYVVLTVGNRNDYSLSLRQVELVLQLDGRDIGNVVVDTVVPLRPIMNQPVRIMVPPRDDDARTRLAAIRAGRPHSYAVRGRARVETPIGLRRIGFEEEIRTR
jgi:hypothetical protein